MMVIPAWEKINYLLSLRIIVVLLVIYSVIVQILGVYFYDFSWSHNIYLADIDIQPERLWSWRNSQLMYIIKRGRIPQENMKEKEYYTVEDGIIDFKSAEFQKHCGYGWSFPEGWGAWALGKESVLYLYFPKTDNRKMTIRAQCFKKRNRKIQTMDIYLNNIFLKRHTFNFIPSNWENITVTIPAEKFTSGIEELKFIYGHDARASYIDARRISVGIEHIEFRQ